MKKMPKIKINIADFFSKNIGILGLVVVIILFSVYMVVQKMNNMESRILELENGKMTTEKKSSESDVEGDFDIAVPEYDSVEEVQ